MVQYDQISSIKQKLLTILNEEEVTLNEENCDDDRYDSKVQFSSKDIIGIPCRAHKNQLCKKTKNQITLIFKKAAIQKNRSLIAQQGRILHSICLLASWETRSIILAEGL